MVAEGWIKSIEVIFEFMELQDANRVRCATFLLTGDARLWWDSALVSVNLQTLTWNDFKEVFYSKYFTEEVCSRLTREFMTLRQGDSSVADFVRKFERRCHFVPLVANDAQGKLRHCMDGLRPVLLRDVRVAGPTTYAIAVSRALAAEQDQRDIEADRQGKMPYQAPPQPQEQRPQFKRPFQGQPGKNPYQGPPKGKGPIQQQGEPQKPIVFPVCPKCNRQHPGPCLYGSGKCFKCGASDHMLKECPQWRQPTRGRVFAMHAQEANPDTTLLTGNIFIKRLATKALIDSRATHSFISETFASHLDVKSIGVDVSYSLTVPSGEELSATSVVRDIDLELQGHLVYADLIVLPMPEFDIILGMNWLTKNRVLIDFQKRSVLVRPLGMEQFLFEPAR
ncbi:uncharacterized protein [Primulina eburnea]|uniref:uncharacterized protein n=1 Tax=Primulina eburnea TaxID=1245227 RepID=UPI003C6C48DE